MTRNRFLTAFLFLTFPAAALFAQRTHTPPTPAQMVANRVTRLATLLSLTSAQQTEITTIFTTEQTALSTTATGLKASRTALKTAVQSNDAAAISTLSAQIGALTGQEVLARSTASAAFYAILTADQQAKYNQLGAARPGFGRFRP